MPSPFRSIAISPVTRISPSGRRGFWVPFKDNFNYPYFADTIAEFWHRWHVSLSPGLRDYLYIPLGGNRRRKPRQTLNLMITMVLGGLWHGAAWNFLIWGSYQRVLLVAHRFLIVDRSFMRNAAWKPLKIVLTFWITCIGWAIFIISDVDRLAFYCRKLMFLDWTTEGLQPIWDQEPLVVFLILAFLVVHGISYRLHRLSDRIARLRTPAWAGSMAAAGVVMYLFAAGQHQSFIYFQF